MQTMGDVNGRSVVWHAGTLLLCLIGVFGAVSLPVALAVVAAGAPLDVISSSWERRFGNRLVLR